MRSIVQNGDPVLREKAAEIPLSDIEGARIRSIIKDMKGLLATEKFGVAIAAPQVGESVRMFVVASKQLIQAKRSKDEANAEEEPDNDYMDGLPESLDEVYINPVIVKTSRKRIDKHEGCLSVRGFWGMVPRAEKVTIRAYNEQGVKLERGASGFLAHIFQHEMDHLDGILYIDKASKIYDDSDERE